MKYMLSIYDDESRWDTVTPEQIGEAMAGYGVFAQEAGDRIVAGEGLQPTATATTVRRRGGERMLTDGPFAETKEQLGGFYLVECQDLDEAIDLASKIPGASTGSVEVRPVMIFENEGAEAGQAAGQVAGS